MTSDLAECLIVPRRFCILFCFRFILSVWILSTYMCMPCACVEEKRVSSSLELKKLRRVLSHHVSDRNETQTSVKANRYHLCSPTWCALNAALVTWLKRPLRWMLRGQDCLDCLIISSLVWWSGSTGICQHCRKFLTVCIVSDTCLCKPSTKKMRQEDSHEFEASLSYLENTKLTSSKVRPHLHKQMATTVL